MDARALRQHDATVRSMSGFRQALRQGARTAFRNAFIDQPGRWWHFLLAASLVLLSIPVFAALALAVRLWAGPLDVTDSARRLAAASGVTLGHVRLTWNGWRQGPSAPLDLLLDEVRIGQSRILQASAALDVLALLHGRASVVALDARDGALVLYRDRDGGITLQAPAPGERGAAPGVRPAADRIDLAQLRRLGITRAVVTVRDVVSGRSCQARIAGLTLRVPAPPARTGATGDFDASLSCGEANASVIRLRARGSEGPVGAAVWRVAADPVVPAAFARIDPALAPLAALDLPVGLELATTVSGGFDRAMRPGELHLTASLGAGTIRMAPAGPDDGVAVRQGSVDLAVSLPTTPDGATRAALSDATLELAGADAPTLHLAGTLSRTGPRIRASLQARTARFGFAGLDRAWPAQLGGGARRWVTGNITAGTGRDLAVGAGLESDGGWSGLRLVRLSGGFDATGLTLHWLRPIAPLQEMDAHLVLEGPDQLRIEARHAIEEVARQGSGHGTLEAGPASVRITGLSRRDQLARIDVHLDGPLQDMLALLAHPRLRLLSRHPLPFADPSGTADAHLVLSIPLVEQVNADDIPIRVDATLTDVHLGRVAIGRDLDHASLSVRAGNDGLKLHGEGVAGGLPSNLAYSMDFRASGPRQTTESGHLSAHVDEAAVRREGFDSAHRFTGAALLDVGYDRRHDGAARVTLALDLAQAGLDTPLWRKAPGVAAQASGVVGLQDGHLVSIDALHADGPGLLLDGHAEIDAGHPHAVVIERFEMARSRGAGRIELPAADRPRAMLFRVVLHGPALDLAPYFSRPGASAVASPPAGSAGVHASGGVQAPWRADLAFRKVLFKSGRTFSGVTLHAEATGTRVSKASLAIEGPTRLTATLSPDQGGRRVALDAQDTGALLAVLGVGERIQGGVLSLSGRMPDSPAGVRLTALARIGPFTVQDAPLAARLASDLSIYGLLSGAPSRQLAVTRLEIPFTLEGDTLRLTGAHASNAALGATLRGPIDLRQDRFDLRGTIVPSYLFNALPGKLPGVGRVFSPEQGGGLLAVTLSITGPIDRPAIRVNPLALLAPGILRRLLFD